MFFGRTGSCYRLPGRGCRSGQRRSSASYLCKDGTDPKLFDAGVTEIVQAPPGVTGAGLCQVLFEAVSKLSEVDAVIFADCGDRLLLPGAVLAYLHLLEGAEIVVGDMKIASPVGRPTGHRFFEGIDIPDRVVGV